MEIKFLGRGYGEFKQSGYWQKRLGHRGIKVNDILDVQLNTIPRYFQLSAEENKEIKLISPENFYNYGAPLYYFSGEIIKLGRYSFTREIYETVEGRVKYENGKPKLSKKVKIIRTIMIVDCGIPVRVIIECWPNTYKEGDHVIFEGGLEGILISDPEPIIMKVKGKVKEKIEKQHIDEVYITLEVKEIEKLVVEKDYPFWLNE